MGVRDYARKEGRGDGNGETASSSSSSRGRWWGKSRGKGSRRWTQVDFEGHVAYGKNVLVVFIRNRGHTAKKQLGMGSNSAYL